MTIGRFRQMITAVFAGHTAMARSLFSELVISSSLASLFALTRRNSVWGDRRLLG
jgi:hypothetical protein